MEWIIRENQNGSSELTHYGVKGMKWGVRKEYEAHPRKNFSVTELRKARYMGIDDKVDEKSPELRKLTDAEKEKLKKIAIGAAVTLGVGAGIYMAYKYDAINRIGDSIKNLNQSDPRINIIAKDAMNTALHDTDMILKKGTIFHRVESVANRDYSKVFDATYVSYRKDDRRTYLTNLKDWAKTGTRVETTLKAIEDIRVPSKNTAKKIFDELWKSDPTYKEKLIKTITDTYIWLNPKAPKALMADIAKKSVERDPFGQAIYSIVRRQEDSKQFIQELQKHGYDAIQDFFDKEGGFTKDPIILFNPSSSVVKIGEQSIRKAIEEARR